MRRLLTGDAIPDVLKNLKTEKPVKAIRMIMEDR